MVELVVREKSAWCVFTDCIWCFARFGTFLKYVKKPMEACYFYETCNFTKSNTPPWVFFTYFKLCKWYQIAQCMAYLQNCRFWRLIWKRKKFLHSTILSETSSVPKSSSFRNLEEFFLLTLARRRPLSYRNQSIDLLCKSMDWFLYDNGCVLKKLMDQHTYSL